MSGICDCDADCDMCEKISAGNILRAQKEKNEGRVDGVWNGLSTDLGLVSENVILKEKIANLEKELRICKEDIKDVKHQCEVELLNFGARLRELSERSEITAKETHSFPPGTRERDDESYDYWRRRQIEAEEMLIRAKNSISSQRERSQYQRKLDQHQRREAREYAPNDY
jgi:hypothetical protein